jgi:uncharacterized membrane protein
MGNESWIYAMPNQSQSEAGLLGMVQYANYVSDGILMPVMLLVIGLIVFLGTMTVATPSGAFTTSAFMCMILGIMLGVLGLLSPTYMYFSIFALGIGILWMIMENKTI